MFITECKTGLKTEVYIEPVTPKELRGIIKTKRFRFDWKREIEHEVFKLGITKTGLIIGLLSLVYFADERWIKINLLESSVENVGKDKEYDRIAGCLIAFACSLSFMKGYDGVVALKPKTELAAHYIRKYHFEIGGMHLYTELRNSESLITEYLREL